MPKIIPAAIIVAAFVTVAPSYVLADSAAVKSECTGEKSPTIKAIQDRGALEWATGLSLPTAAKDAEGKFIGVEPDNAKELAEILGVKLNIRDYTYDLLPPTVATGRPISSVPTCTSPIQGARQSTSVTHTITRALSSWFSVTALT